ncbi:hypothetical protein EIK77_004403 [Talaromyces pinophilus]|nr:hypothetical protein EIK77_004403 [Talaromyces pinophilus]
MEYRQPKTGQKTPFLIEVEYLTEKQIEEQVRDLLWSYRLRFDSDIKSDTVSGEEYHRIQRESERAWLTLQAAFKQKKEFSEKFLSDESDGALETVASKLIQWTRDGPWPKTEGREGLWISTAENAKECCDKTNEFMQDRLRPFTKIIR